MIDRDLQAYRDLLENIFELAYEGIVITDPDGRIVMMNKTYRDFLEVEDVIGKHVTEVIENTRMHIVAKTGRAEIADIHRVKGHDMIASRIPMTDEKGNVIAVVGKVIFQDVRQLQALASTVDRLKQELAYYKGELRRKLGATYRFEQIVSLSRAMADVKSLALKVARSDTTVLITGESGTGKELFAHAIHAASPRELGPFIRVNCAAIPDSLLESELFGYEEGAFTGAVRKGKKGKFELAHHGTILLDEIGDMPLALQAKLLRVLQEKEVERVGGLHPISIDVRVIASTNRNLREMMEQGKFREDLYYRLNVVNLRIPPLRERMEDLPLLIDDLLDKLGESTGCYVREIDPEARRILESYTWPGNVRELRNVLERAMHLMETDRLEAKDVLASLSASRTVQQPVSERVQTLRESVEQAEREAIRRALAATRNNKREAAKLLGISKSSFYLKLEKYGIDES
jgi:transcriptional regulator with PAS, ATPase and Fis domain